MADHIFVTSFLSGKPANTAQYSMILLGQSDLRRPKKKLHFLDWSGTSLLLDAQKSRWREGLRFDAKWWILETNSPILKSIQAKAKSNSTKQSKESEYYMYIFITYLITSLNELVRGQLKFTMQEGHEVSKTLRFLSSSMIYSIDVTIKFIKGLF